MESQIVDLLWESIILVHLWNRIVFKKTQTKSPPGRWWFALLFHSWLTNTEGVFLLQAFHKYKRVAEF